MLQIQLTLDEQAAVLHWQEICDNGKPPVHDSRELSHEQAEAVLRQMEAILGQQPQAVPAEPMVTLYAHTKRSEILGCLLTNERESLEMTETHADERCIRLISFRLPRRLWEPRQAEVVEAANTTEVQV